MKVKLWIDTGFAGCTHEETIEVDDNATEKEIEDIAEEWFFDRIEYGWSIEGEDWEDTMNIPKFRAWILYGYTDEDLKNPDMVEEIQETGLGFMGTPDLIDFRNDEIRVKYDCDWYDSDRFTLMQSTGLKDKNGKEIFEGDIIFDEFYKKRGQIIFVNSAFFIKYDYTTEPVFKNYSDVEVIGNIYENPELLKEGAK